MIVHLSAEAEYDLEAIGDYIARDNPARALSFLEELRSKCLDLVDMPKRFPLVPRYETSSSRLAKRTLPHVKLQLHPTPRELGDRA